MHSLDLPVILEDLIHYIMNNSSRTGHDGSRYVDDSFIGRPGNGTGIDNGIVTSGLGSPGIGTLCGGLR